jgi:uncharacterized damage-inducible protein DinB
MDILDRLLGHNAWITRKMIERCRTLSPEEFARRFEIGPGSVHDTLLHTVDVMFGWADRIAGRPRRPNLDERPWSVDDLLAKLDEAEAALERTANDVRDAGRYEEMMELEHDGTRYRFTRGTALAHVLTHGMHHRAQVFNMFRRLGVAFDLDGDVIEWEIAQRRG